jgi:hypothetical protein
MGDRSLSGPEGLAAACGFLDPGSAEGLTLACALVAALLAGAVAAGFLRLRSARRVPACGCGAASPDGLLATWRLYRQLGRAAEERR